MQRYNINIAANEFLVLKNQARLHFFDDFNETHLLLFNAAMREPEWSLWSLRSLGH